MNNTNYRDHPALNWSHLKRILDCPLAFKENLPLDSKAADLGTLLHSVLLEGYDKYINFDELVEPYLANLCDDKGNLYKSPKQSTKGKEIVSQLAKQYAGYTFCSAEEIEMIEFYKKEFASNFAIKTILEGAKTEQEVFERLGGRDCKCKADIITKNNLLFDLKTTVNIHPEAFKRQVFKLDYHAQIAFYSALSKAYPGGIIVISTKKPYQVSIVEFSAEVIEHAKLRVEKAFSILEQCERTNSFTGYGNYTIELPKWLDSESIDDDEDLF